MYLHNPSIHSNNNNNDNNFYIFVLFTDIGTLNEMGKYDFRTFNYFLLPFAHI
jgi:hypothetical protein